jgi:hypothetical protein
MQSLITKNVLRARDKLEFQIADIIGEEDRLELIEMYSKLPSEVYHQDYNLFHCEKRIASIKNSNPYECNALKKIFEYVSNTSDEKIRLVSAYFVKYTEGSFVRMHNDNGTYRTVVTLLDSQDLVGGDTIYCKRYKRRPRKSNHIAKRHRFELDKPPYGKGIIQSVARIKDGQSVVYGKDVRHGVTEVEQGQRIVFVTWFLDEKSKVKPLSSD